MLTLRSFLHTALTGVFLLGLTTKFSAPGRAEEPKKGQHHFSLIDKRVFIEREDEDSQVALSAIDTEGRVSVLDEVWHPAFKVPRHFHKQHAEIFYIISGQIEWTVGGETHVMKAGDMVYIPPNTIHTTRVVGGKDARSMMTYLPGGYEDAITREKAYTPEQRKDPKIIKLLEEQEDFNPVEPAK